jgi:RimJ/RimL family protein N-acetyltransferase
LIPNWPFQTDIAALRPYAPRELRELPHDFLSQVWRRLMAEDLMDTAYPGMGDTSHDTWVGYMGKKTAQVLCDTRRGRLEPVGICFLDAVDGTDGARKGLFGFVFFRKVWGTRVMLDLLWLMLAYWMNQLKIDVLFGMTLQENWRARRISARYGFAEVADIPSFLYRNGELANATLVMLTRETFSQRFLTWHEQRREEMARGKGRRNLAGNSRRAN